MVKCTLHGKFLAHCWGVLSQIISILQTPKKDLLRF